MKKKAIRYLRFSHKGQSNSSIEKQELYTGQWIERNNIELVDTFIDAGHSAKTFDRPDFIKLQDFIARHHQNVDYLIVDQLDRFSRDAGQAIVLVKQLQLMYKIQIVSVSENITYDYNTSGSFFRTGLQLLFAEEDNINRANKINGGIYTAKAKEGRYIGVKAPLGYIISGKGKTRRLVVDEAKAPIIKFIFQAYLKNTPVYIIEQDIRDMGVTIRGNSVIEKMLANPLYAGMQHVKAYRDLPGGLFEAEHEPIIDIITWEAVQKKLNGSNQQKFLLSDNLPLRHLLKCHCGCYLTGAPSRGRHGKQFYYYKCKHSGHNNISAKKAHQQLDEILKHMSLPYEMVQRIREKSENQIEEKLKESKALMVERKRDLTVEQEKLVSIEEKYIANQLNHDTYQRWHTELTANIRRLTAQISRLGENQAETYQRLYYNLERLTDLHYLYHNCSISDKQELLNKGFDNNLYYKNGAYRTHTILRPFSHNLLEMSEKGLLFLDEKTGDFNKISQGGAEGSRTPVAIK